MKSFEEFYSDMYPTYKKWLTVEREDNDWNYCKSNCKWATMKEQSNNRRPRIKIEEEQIKVNMKQLDVPK